MTSTPFTADTEQPTLAVLLRDGELPLTFNLKVVSRSPLIRAGRLHVTESVMPEGWVLSHRGRAPSTASTSSRAASTSTQRGQNATCTFSNCYPQLSLTKEVGTSASGPWGKEVTVQVGSDIYYRMTVTNSGNAPPPARW